MGIVVKVNCVDNDRGAWCKNKNIKRSLWGLGARCCTEYDNQYFKKCEYKKPHKRMKVAPAPQKNKIC